MAIFFFLDKNVTLVWNIYTFYGEVDVNNWMSNVQFYTGHFITIIMLEPYKEIF